MIFVLLSASLSRTNISGLTFVDSIELSSPQDIFNNKAIIVFSMIIIMCVLFLLLQKKYHLFDGVFNKLNNNHGVLPNSLDRTKKRELARKPKMIKKLKEVYGV